MAKSLTGRTTDELESPKQFAKPYSEEKEQIDIDDLAIGNAQHSTLDITYQTRRGSKTVRSHCWSPAGDWNDIPEGFASFYDGGRKYAYNPAERRLITVPRNSPNRTLAQGDGIYKIEVVSFGERAPVVGAVGKDRPATIYYRSPRSDRMQQVTVRVKYLEGDRSAARITGKDENGRRIDALTRWERDIESRHTTLGKVARVEFPRGHRFTVSVEGIGDDKAKRGVERLEKYAGKAFKYADSVDAEHDGPMEWGPL